MYVEPEGYFTPSMKKILEEGEKKKTKINDKKSKSKNKKRKNSRITIDDKWISRIALGIDDTQKTNKKH